MENALRPQCTAFLGMERVACGDWPTISAQVRQLLARDPGAPVLIFDDQTGEQVEIDWRELAEQAVPGSAERAKGRGRPKLGVLAREVTLLPRHWEWLAKQPGGASVALRKLVEHASKSNREQDRLREGREAMYRFASAIAGNEPGFEEAMRKLFGGDEKRFRQLIDGWPIDIREHAGKMAFAAFAGEKE